MPNLGMPELLVILLVALLVVGPKKLPEVGRHIGRALREFRKVTGMAQEQIQSVINIQDDAPKASVDDIARFNLGNDTEAIAPATGEVPVAAKEVDAETVASPKAEPDPSPTLSPSAAPVARPVDLGPPSPAG